MLSSIIAQNDGLVITKYDNGGIKVEGNYTNGLRNGYWNEYWVEAWWYDFGEDGEPNTKDTLENNNQWDSIEVVIPDFKPKLKLQGNYLNGNRDGTWTEFYQDGKRKTELNYSNGKFSGLQSYWSSNGNKVEEKNYIHGKQQGLWTIYYEETGIKKEETMYLGDDINDLTVTNYVGIFAVPSDAHEACKKKAKFIGNKKGGKGFIREITDNLLLSKGIDPFKSFATNNDYNI